MTIYITTLDKRVHTSRYNNSVTSGCDHFTLVMTVLLANVTLLLVSSLR